MSPLTRPQFGTLAVLTGNGEVGYDKPAGQTVLAALARRGYAEYRGTRSGPDVRRWFATPAGHERIDDERPKMLSETTDPHGHWVGEKAPGSRWTRAQLDALRARRFRTPEQCPAVRVARYHTDTPKPGEPGPRVVHVVPRLQMRGNGSEALVIRPNGSIGWERVYRG